MKSSRPYALLAGGALILALSLWFNHAQASVSSGKALTQAYASRYLVPARDLKLAMERGLNFGKPINLFNGTEKIFQDRLAGNPGITLLSVTSPSGKVLYSTDPASVGAMLEAAAGLPDFSAEAVADTGKRHAVVEEPDRILIALPIFFNQQSLEGLAWLAFSRNTLNEHQNRENSYGLLVMLAVLAATLALFSLLFLLLSRPRAADGTESGGQVSAKAPKDPLRIRLTVCIGLLLLVSLGSYTLLASRSFTASLLSLYQGNIEVLARSVSADLEKLFADGLEPADLRGMDDLLARQLRDAPEVSELALAQDDGTVLFAAGRSGSYRHREYGLAAGASNPVRTIDLGSGGYLARTRFSSQSGASCLLTGRVDQDYLDSMVMDRLLDALTISLVSIVLSAELLLALKMLTGAIQVGRRRTAALAAAVQTPEDGLKVVRFTAFLFFLAELLPLPFLPLFINDLTTHSPVVVASLSSDAVNSLPFSSHLLGVMIFIPVAGYLAQRFSLRSLFLVCTALLAGGNLLAAMASDWTALMVFRLVSGLGYGGMLSISAGLVIALTTKDNRATGFGQWSAGFAAASICAMALGGVIVTNFGYRIGLVVSAGLSAVLGLFILLYHVANKPAPDVQRIKFHISDLVAPFRERSIVAALLFASIPAQIAFFGLFQFTLPLSMHQIGLSEANIGRILTIYGLLSLATPLIARMSDRLRNERIFIIVGNLLTGGVLMFFFLQSGVLSMAITVAAIGIGGMMVDAVMESYLSLARESERIGETKFLSIFSTWEKLITVFIPVMAGTLMTLFGYIQSAAIMGIMIVAGTILFMMFSRNLHKDRHTQGCDND
jgi:predicted MFS family arabinose efflux permease